MILSTHGVLASQIASFDADAVAFFDRVTTAGGSLSLTEKQAVNQLVLDMKSYGIWSAMKAVYPMVGASAAACAQNLKSSSFTGTFTSGWTFASTGVTPNGTSAYMDTNLNSLNNLSLNNYSFGYYSRTNNTSVSIIGSETTSILAISLRGTNTLLAGGLNYGLIDFTDTNSLGFYQLSRNASNLFKGYKNNILKATDLTATGSNLPNLNVYLAALNKNNSSLFYDNRQVAFSYLGDGLTDTQASNFYTAVQAFNTTLSRQV